MKHYTVAQLDVGDRGWVRDYIANVTPMVERRGGRYLARTASAERIEGEREPRQTTLIIEWPSREAADEFYDSEEYRPFREARLQGSSGEFFIVAGADDSGTANVPQ